MTITGGNVGIGTATPAYHWTMASYVVVVVVDSCRVPRLMPARAQLAPLPAPLCSRLTQTWQS